MPLEALRFIHAANVLIDHPLTDLGPQQESIWAIAENATQIAFDRIIAECLEREVDFLLLVENTYAATDCSLTARTGLLNGFRQLEEHEIPVFVVPGNLDPAADWVKFDNRPGNVTLFIPGSDEPLAVLRNGRVIATIDSAPTANVRTNSTQPESPNADKACLDRPMLIHVVPVGADVPNDPGTETTATQLANICNADYLALGGVGRRSTESIQNGTAHHPGGIQGMSPKDSGSHGCTLVELSDDGSLECSMLSTAPIRFEQFELLLDESTGRDELIELMATALEGVHAEPTENVWIIQWTVQGDGPMFAQLSRQSVQAEILELIREQSLLPADVLHRHRFRSCPESTDENISLTTDSLAAEYFEQLDHDAGFNRQLLLDCLQDATVPKEPWFARLSALVDDLDHRVVEENARRLGVNCFAASREEGSSHED